MASNAAGMDAQAVGLLALSGLGVASIIAASSLQPRTPQRAHLSVPPAGAEYPQEIKNELFARITSFFGEDGAKKLENSFVVVVGLGGVGSHCAHMLVRSGVGRLRLIDFDQVTLSSLNRHAVATIEDVGIPKAVIMQRRLNAIVPWCQLEAATAMFKMEEAATLLAGSPDFVIDCIDDVNTKAELLAYCLQKGLPVVTSMGAGGKSDPTRLRIAPLSECINDPLAQKIKWKLKKHGVAAEQVMSVFSVEKPVCELLPLDDEQKGSPQDFGTVDYLRLRIMPVLGTSPSTFGQALAAHILCSLGGKLFEPEVCERMSKNLKHKLRQVYRNNEIKRFGHDGDINLDDDDVEFIVQQIWRSRCAVTNKRFGGHIMPTLTRWEASEPPTPYNLVLMMQADAQRLHEEGHAAFPPELVRRIGERLAWAKRVCLEEDLATSRIHLPGSPAPTRSTPSVTHDANGLCVQALSVAGGLCLGVAVAMALQRK